MQLPKHSVEAPTIVEIQIASAIFEGRTNKWLAEKFGKPVSYFYGVRDGSTDSVIFWTVQAMSDEFLDIEKRLLILARRKTMQTLIEQCNAVHVRRDGKGNEYSVPDNRARIAAASVLREEFGMARIDQLEAMMENQQGSRFSGLN